MSSKIETSVMMGSSKLVGKLIEPANSVELRGHQRGSQILNLRGGIALRSSVVFRAGGEEKLLVLLTCHNPIGMLQIGVD